MKKRSFYTLFALFLASIVMALSPVTVAIAAIPHYHVSGDSGGLIFHENLGNIRDHTVAGIVVASGLYVSARRIGTYLGAWPS